MKSNSILKAKLAKGKPTLYLFLVTILFAISTITACNNHNNRGNTAAAASNDTSSTVTDKVDTVAGDNKTKQ